MKQFTDVDCAHGAPMGRVSYGVPLDCPAHSIRLFRVQLFADYDDGGAYWGGGRDTPPLYCARCETGYRAFIRAKNRHEAAKKLGLPNSFLRRGVY